MTVINTTRKATLILRNMPRDIRDHFKGYAAKRGRTMKAMLLEFMMNCIDSDNNPKPPRKKKHGHS